MSDGRCLRSSCHHRTNGIQSIEEDGQQAGCTSCSARFFRCSDNPLRRRAEPLARVDAGRLVLHLDCPVSTALGPNGAYPDYDADSRRGGPAQCWSHCALGRLPNRGRAIRPARRPSRTGTSGGPLRAAACDLRRDGSRLGLVPGPPGTVNTGVRKRDHPAKRDRCRSARLHRGSGFRFAARPTRARWCRAQSPRGERRTFRRPSRS